MALNKIIN